MLILQVQLLIRRRLQPFQVRKKNRHFVAFAPVKATTDVSENPKLPETVTAIYSDGSVEEKAVVWAIPR